MEQNEKIRSKYQGEKDYEFADEYCKLGKKITDVVPHKLFGVKVEDPEYWGLTRYSAIVKISSMKMITRSRFTTRWLILSTVWISRTSFQSHSISLR